MSDNNTENRTYGSRFLDVLDKAAIGRKFKYAERQAMRQMGRNDAIAKLKLNRYSVFSGIDRLTAEEAAQRFVDELLLAQQNASIAVSGSVGLHGVISLLGVI